MAAGVRGLIDQVVERFGRLDGAVNTAGTEGQVGVAGASVYVASKHAVEGLTKSAALEGAAAGVRVNSAAPGPVATEMLDRFVGGSEKAKAVPAFLTSSTRGHGKRRATPVTAAF